MKTLFSTVAVHPRDRFDYWHEVACKTVVEHDSKPERLQSFEAELQAGTLADIDLVLFENSAMSVTHTARHAAHAADELIICRQTAETLVLEQNSREVVLEAGDITLLDPTLPYTGRFFAGSRMLVLKVPRRALEARLGNTQEITARGIKPLAAESSLASSFLGMLPIHAGRFDQAGEELVKAQTLDLVAMAVAKSLDGQKPCVSSAGSIALVKLRAAVEAHLADPALDADTVAAAAGVSVRYANALFAQEGTSIMRFVQARRLERCRKALEDPLQARRTLSEIAYGWGFSDMTHFGRRFRSAYGILPSEYRSQAPAVR